MIPQISKAVVIGASAGALDALTTILSALPTNYKLPIMIVVHIPPDKESVMASLFQAKCKLEVKEAEDKEDIKSGTVYLAPPDYHMLVEDEKYISLSSDEPVLFSRPSIDVLFESAADAYAENLIGVILTGANNDGSEGLRSVCEAGGIALVQDPETAFAGTMPQSALNKCPEALKLSLNEIAQYLIGG